MSTEIITGDCVASMQRLKEQGRKAQMCVTSPPYYGLRNYGVDGQIGAEETPQQFIDKMVKVFSGARDLLSNDGVLWLNLGDSYAGSGRGPSESFSKDKGGEIGNQQPGRGASLRPKIGAQHGASGHTSGVRAPDGFKVKDMLMIPARVAIALQADGWYLRAACPWIKRNGMPDSTTSRPTQCIETMFMLTKSRDCFYDSEAVKKAAKTGANGSKFDKGKTAEHQLNRASTAERKEDGTRLRRTSDWFFESWQGMLLDADDEPSAFVVNTKGYKGAHFATFPPALIEPCVLATSRPGDTVLDPFGGSGTTGEVAAKHGRNAILLELNPAYVSLIHQRLGLIEEIEL